MDNLILSGEDKRLKQRAKGKRNWARVKADPKLYSEWIRRGTENRKIRLLNPEYAAKIRAERRKRRETPEGWAKVKLAQTRVRANKVGIKFTLTVEDIYLAIPPDRICPILGEPFVFGPPSDLNPSIDRLIPKRGYVKENIRIISKQANIIKNSCVDPVVFEQLAKWLRIQLGLTPISQ